MMHREIRHQKVFKASSPGIEAVFPSSIGIFLAEGFHHSSRSCFGVSDLGFPPAGVMYQGHGLRRCGGREALQYTGTHTSAH